MTTASRPTRFALALAALFTVGCGLPPEEGDESFTSEEGTESDQAAINVAPPCSDSSQCEPGYYCKSRLPKVNTGNACPTAANPGYCWPKGASKSDCSTYFPACGCDGRNYQTECDAKAAGVAVANLGACPVPVPPGSEVKPITPLGPPCISDAGCSADRYCMAPLDQCGGRGTCEPRDGCGKFHVGPLPKVCGCDGRIYANRCAAARAGMNLAKCPS